MYMKKTIKYILLYLTQFFLEWELFKAKLVEEIDTNILRLITFRKSCRLRNSVGKCSRIGQVRDHNMLHI